ncbi:MAG: dihydroorotate dehydrogenase [Planctomycetota bacterium]
MPDWSYRTVFRPVLFRLPPALARDVALGCMGTLARLPWGPAVIDFMGHMRPDRRLAHAVGDTTFPTRVGLGACVDPQLQASRAFAQFGIAFWEIGPVTLQGIPGGPIYRDAAKETLQFTAPMENPGLTAVIERLDRAPQVPPFVWLELHANDADQESLEKIIQRLGTRPAGFILQVANPANAVDRIERLAQYARTCGPQILLVAVTAQASAEVVNAMVLLTQRQVINGVYVDGSTIDGDGSRHVGPAAGMSQSIQTLHAVQMWRAALPGGATIIVEGGIHEPRQALELIDAGSDFVSISSGLIFTGPGLIKRINEALLHRLPIPQEDRLPPEDLSWFWTCLMAVGMLIGGMLAMIIATTRVVMPYDETMAGLTRNEICAINPQLIHFMAHDRVTLAGTMLAVGILYLALSVYGSRQGMHWARRTMIVSASTGFVSFFLFLGFGYFDPFHAFVTAVLFQLLIMAVHCGLPRYHNPVTPELTNDGAWLRAQWGQLLFVIHGAVLIVAGGVIAAVGISTVFVQEDLEFMQTSAELLFGAHPRLVPLIAHDRATFGGMLIACGSCVLLSALWGFRRGHGWLWWALMTAGITAYGATILIHWHVGYLSPSHLFPAYAGLGWLVVSGILSYGHLCGGWYPSRNNSPPQRVADRSNCL